jgi:fatty-acyl-CoA synthase
MYPRDYVETTPDKAAFIIASTGEEVSYLQLEQRANRAAHLFRTLGLKAGDHIAIFMENNRHFMEIVWGAQRAGLIYTAISTHLKHDEVLYIADNCEAKVLITSPRLSGIASEIASGVSSVDYFYMVEHALEGFNSWDEACTGQSDQPIEDEEGGIPMLYSSGTTGTPKGVLPARPGNLPIDSLSAQIQGLMMLFGFDSDTVYLSPAPLYHAAPLANNLFTMYAGGTSIIMDSFDAENSLALIERYRVTLSQWVPIMFTRMLKLPAEVRTRYDISSMKNAFHAAAPCPVEVKQQMIDWWGPIILEYYSATESHGVTFINSKQWLAHRGSVGLPMACEVHILDDEQRELPTEEVGEIYFSKKGPRFEYYKEGDKTSGAYNNKGYASVGDMGYVDEDGFLYLTDRRNFMIITGGVNVYPQEVENLIITHPEVADVAVFGIPSEQFGEEVKAVVQALDPEVDTEALASRLDSFCQERLSRIKCPRSYDFMAELPRLDNGKLYKRHLQERYQKNL